MLTNSKVLVVLMVYSLTSAVRIESQEKKIDYPPLLYVLQSKLLYLRYPDLYERLLSDNSHQSNELSNDVNDVNNDRGVVRRERSFSDYFTPDYYTRWFKTASNNANTEILLSSDKSSDLDDDTIRTNLENDQIGRQLQSTANTDNLVDGYIATGVEDTINEYDDYLSTSRVKDKVNEYLISIFDYYSPISVQQMQEDAYLSRLLLVLKIVNFFYSPLGFVDQIMFTVKICSIAWKAADMYNNGQSGTDIAWKVAPDIISAATMSRRDEEEVLNEDFVKPGQIIDVSNMDVPTFLLYVHNLKFPPLTKIDDQILTGKIRDLVESTFTDSSKPENGQTKSKLITALTDTVKFIVLYGQKGEVKGQDDEDLSAISKIVNNVKLHPSLQQEHLLQNNIKKILGNAFVANRLTDFIEKQFSDLPA